MATLVNKNYLLLSIDHFLIKMINQMQYQSIFLFYYNILIRSFNSKATIIMEYLKGFTLKIEGPDFFMSSNFPVFWL